MSRAGGGEWWGVARGFVPPSHMIAFWSKSTCTTSLGIRFCRSASAKTSSSIPIRKGTGACRMSSRRAGRIGM